jgi:hypothetical protein
MIIGNDFVWLHFPKCAGTFTERLLHKVVPPGLGVQFDPIDPANVIWHQNYFQRENYLRQSLSGKDVICNFRRLPSWIISRIKYEQERSGQVVSKEAYSKGFFFEQNGTENHADNYVREYTKKTVSNWLRVEYLHEDFINVFSKYFDLENKCVSEIFMNKVNASGWDGNICKWFDKEDLKILYESCPKWAALELELYGNIMQ